MARWDQKTFHWKRYLKPKLSSPASAEEDPKVQHLAPKIEKKATQKRPQKGHEVFRSLKMNSRKIGQRNWRRNLIWVIGYEVRWTLRREALLLRKISTRHPLMHGVERQRHEVINEALECRRVFSQCRNVNSSPWRLHTVRWSSGRRTRSGWKIFMLSTTICHQLSFGLDMSNLPIRIYDKCCACSMSVPSRPEA